MGDEAVAIHLTDTWFAPGLIDMGGDDVLLEAKIFDRLQPSVASGDEGTSRNAGNS